MPCMRRIAQRCGAGAGRLRDGRERQVRQRRRGGALAGRGRRASARMSCSSPAAMPRWMARGRAARRRRRRRRHRHQHGLPGQAGHRRLVGLGADARPRPRLTPDRGDGRGGHGAGDGEDAARLGRRQRCNAPELARRAEAAGAAMVTVHGRTRSQFYKGSADWRGDPRRQARRCRSPSSPMATAEPGRRARAMLAPSGADAVMVGRAASGPALAGRRRSPRRSPAGRDAARRRPRDQRELALEHYDGLLGALRRTHRACATPASTLAGHATRAGRLSAPATGALRQRRRHQRRDPREVARPASPSLRGEPSSTGWRHERRRLAADRHAADMPHEAVLNALPHAGPARSTRDGQRHRRQHGGRGLLRRSARRDARASPDATSCPSARRCWRWSSRCASAARRSTNTGSISARRGSARSASSTSRSRRCSDDAGGVVLMLQERTIADKMDRQLTHRGAARSVTALGAMLAHEIKNPLSGIRGAAQLLEQSVDDEDRALTQLICDETDRIVKLVDRMEVFSDERPVEREPGQHPRRARPREALGAVRLRAAHPLRRGLRPVAAAGARQPRPADPGVPQPGQERRRGDRRTRSTARSS